MGSITIQEAQAKLPELIRGLAPGDEVFITDGRGPVARLLPAALTPTRKRRQLGTLRGTVIHVAPDFDAPLEDFREYME